MRILDVSADGPDRTKGEVSFDEPLNVDWDGNELLLSDILGARRHDEVYGHLEEEVNRKLLGHAMRQADRYGSGR